MSGYLTYYQSNGCFRWYECHPSCHRSVQFFTTTQLHSRTQYVDGHLISEYDLIKSRCPDYNDQYLICSLHRHLFCERYIPNRWCSYHGCYSTNDLAYIGVRAALAIGNVPIFGLLCVMHRNYYEQQMLARNLRCILITRPESLPVMDCQQLLSENKIGEHANSRSYSTMQKSEASMTSTTMRDPEAGQSFEPTTDQNQQFQSNISRPIVDECVIQVKDTNRNHQKRRPDTQSSPSQLSSIEPMEVQKYIQIEICADLSSYHQSEAITLSETDTFSTLKAKIIERFPHTATTNDVSLFYKADRSENSRWKKLKNEEENRLPSELSFNHDYIATCAAPDSLEIKSTASHNAQPSNCSAKNHALYPLPGLINFGNTCFMNSALQCLNHIKPFFDYFHSDVVKTLLYEIKNSEEAKWKLTQLYQELIDSFCSPLGGPVAPRELHFKFGQIAPHFYNYYQHDAIEFLNILLDTLHEGLMQITQKDDTIISELFHAQITTEITCRCCRKPANTDDSFSFLPLPVPEQHKDRTSQHTSEYKLDDCFRLFFQSENIGDHGKWYCEHCKELTDANKTLALKKLPPVLIIQFKRFNYNLRSHAKNNTLIAYDLDNFDVNEYVDSQYRNNRTRYNLIAVVNHQGNLLGGHFVTYAKLPRTSEWYEYNDDQVIKADKSIHENNSRAYILLYQQEENVDTGTAV
ncbi:unnamed protein product [Adineta ricciae]|uniref:Ubiquitin carboxyl-terminal hydrolase n=1 Tax=Adineta ricciae TaxID=249248 RepID=A0A815DHR4_ADIRI|nr:unnamed protein product [Adineta ricciae]CAF1298027.1 unnamed protein product [Adineta ricciae]